MSNRWIARDRDERGFTLAEMIVVVFLLAVAMLGILAVFDASARINKSETEVADAQGAVRFGIYQMSSAIRMAGSGGLFLTQAILNHRDPNLAGITVTNSVDANSYDNVETGTVVTGLDGPHPVRPGTDMIEVRGVINSPMIGFDQTAQNGCLPCVGSVPLTAKATVGSPLLGQHVNEDVANRPQFEAIDALTAPLDPPTSGPPMYVIVSQNDDLHNGCSQPNAQNPNPQPHYSQPTYRVGKLSQATKLVASGTFGNVDFSDAIAVEFDNEFPSAAGAPPAAPLAGWLRHAGIMDDLVYFIDDKDPDHPVLAQGTRRGAAFDVIPLADDVEDMQIAYGVDTDNNEMVNRLVPPNPPSDPDLNVSNQPQGDEWVPNVPGSDNQVTGSAMPFQATNFVANAAGALSTHCAHLHGVMVSLLARSKNPDPSYRALTARLALMNAPAPTPGPRPLQFRRRVQTLKINLRNYAFQG